MLSLLDLYRPAPFAPPLPAEQAARSYPRYRLQMMLSIFTGYAGFYLVRNNFSMAKPYLISQLHMTTGDVGLIAAALTMSYGVSKFVMGNVSDRSNPRYFMATGLILSGLVNLLFGFLPGLWTMIGFWFLNGWFQGMGWAPCARVLTHWFSDRERGTHFATWNTAHNVGGAMAALVSSAALYCFVGYQSVFWVPGILAIVIGIGLLLFLRDTPQSVGLPSVEEYKDDYPPVAVDDRERELSAREILFGYVLNNRALWILALANVLVYVVRYGVLNWAPTYLVAMKGYAGTASRWQYFLYESAGIPGMLISGYASDRFFQGRRAPMSVLFMVLVTGAVLLYWKNPAGHPLVDSAALIALGFFIYGPVMLIGVAAVDLVPKKAAGTAAGFTGLFGYLGATLAELGIGKVVQHWGWDVGFLCIIGAAIASTGLLAMTWNLHSRSGAHAKEAAAA